MGGSESLGASFTTATNRRPGLSKPVPLSLGGRRSVVAGGADLTLSLEYGTTSSPSDSRTSFSGTRRRIVPNGADFTSAKARLSSRPTDSMSPILYPLESKISRPSKLSMLRVLNEVPPKMVFAVARSLWRCVKPCPISVARGRVPSLPPYPWRSIPNVRGGHATGTAVSAVPWCRRRRETSLPRPPIRA
jgi:hypothetical protein